MEARPGRSDERRDPRREDRDRMRRLYDWFYRFYGLIELNVGPTLDRALDALDPGGDRFSGDTVLEWACGSGELGYRLLPRVGRYEGRDLSAGMLGRARGRWPGADEATRAKYGEPPFRLGDMAQGPEPGERWDWVWMSFAIHLFEPETEKDILAKALSAARKGVIVIDHEQRWGPLVALVERLEGSHYRQYLDIDFGSLAESLGVERRVYQAGGPVVLELLTSPGDRARP